MERKLASIQTIRELLPIEGADAIELAVVNGWKVVVAKNAEHKVGEQVVYCEIDSFLPIREAFEFLRKSSYKKMGEQEGFRLRTIKLRGQVSQGLILPVSVLGNFDRSDCEGLDVTAQLGIVKYEPPMPAELSGKVKGAFPGFLRKTDEERIQNLAPVYEEMKKSLYYVTEKLDGTSATFYFRDGEFGVCSRNLELLETDDNTFWKVARQLDLEEKLRALEKNICLQGELIGEGIQGNPYKLKGQLLKFFNAYRIDDGAYYDFLSMAALLDSLGLETVPVLDTNYQLPPTIEILLSDADGKSGLNENADREELVIRSHDRAVSFKAISNKFLLKNDG